MLQRLFCRRRPRALAPAPRFRLDLLTLEERTVPSGVPNSWSVRGGGGGGSLFSPQINPANPNEYYVSSDMSQLFRTTDAGVTWKDVDFRQVQGNHESRVQYTEDPNILYTLDYSTVDGSDLVRPIRSTNGGATWQPLGNDPTGGGAFYFLADPANHNRLVLTDYSTLYFSSDGGQTWAQKDTANNSGAGFLLSGAFWDGANIYLGTNDGILASTNGGTSFGLMNLTGIPATQAIRSFSAAKQGATTRFLVVTDDVGDIYGGVQGYDNNGGTALYTLDLGQTAWTARSLPTGTWPFYSGMALNNTTTLYVAGGSSSGVPTVYKSTNGGSTWTSVFQTTNNQNIQTGWSGQGGDRGWGYGELALGFVVSTTDANRLIITDYGFAHSSTDGGTNWKALYVSPADLNPAGQNTPTGKAYHDSGLDNTTAWQVTWADANNLFISNSDVRGQLSTDGGATFGYGYTGHTNNSMYRVAVGANGTLYGATGTVHDLYQSTYLQDSRIDGGTGSVLFSANKGATWQTLHSFSDVVSWVAVDPNNSNRVYASVVNSTAGGIYVTNNANLGASSTWTKLANPPRTEGHPFNIVVLNDGTLVVSYSGRRNSAGTFTASSGVFVSTDGGTTWADRSASGMSYWTKDVVVDPGDATQNTWYAGVFSGWGGPPNGLGGLYKTTNRGVTWSRILTLDRVTSATINPNDTNEMFVTTETQGLWYSNNIRSASPTFTQVQSFAFRQPERVFFNPYNANEVLVTSFGGGVRVGTTATVGSPGTIQLSSASYSVNESSGSITVTVNRLGGSTGAVSVQFATSNGNATAGSDYTAANGTLSWADGDASAKTFQIAITDDTAVESSETINVLLSTASGGATLGSPASAIVTIADNDLPPSPPPPPPPPPGITAGLGGVAFLDLNANGVKDAGDTPIGGLTVYLDLNNNGSLDGGEPSSLTNASGTYFLGNVAAGGYAIREILLGGQALTGNAVTGSLAVVMTAGVDQLAANLGNRNNSGVLPLPTTPPLFTAGSPNANTSYVQNLYRALLGRDGDSAGVVYWVNQLSRGVSQATVIRAFTTSDEWYGNLVDRYYTTYLGRTADAGGRSYWVSLLRGGASAETLLVRLLTSGEASARYASNESFVHTLYRNILSRIPSSAEVAGWTNALATGAMSRTQITTIILRSGESANRIVESLYVQFLQREGDAGGKSFWRNQYQTGGTTLFSMVNAFVGSPEFFAKAAAAV